MKRWTILGLPLLLAGLALYSCVQGSATNTESQSTDMMTAPVQPLEKSGTPTSTPALTHTPSNTPPPSLTPTLTPTAGPSPTQAPTPVFGSARVSDDFLFGNQPPGCELPCWQGLVIGESDAGDIQSALDTAFGFRGSYDFLEHVQNFEDLPGLIVTGYSWDFATDPSPSGFGISVWVHQDTRFLEAITFQGISTRFNRFTNPQLVLRELGAPSMMWAKVEESEAASKGSGQIIVIYGKGIAIDYPSVPVSISRRQDGSGVAELCLGPLSPSYKSYWVEIFLTRPIPDELDVLSPLQKELFGNTITMSPSPYVPFEDAFGLSLEEVANLAQQQEDLCVYTNVP